MDVPQPPEPDRPPPFVPPPAPPALRIAAIALVIGVALGLAWVGRIFIRLHAPDFEYFYKSGAWLLNQGTLDPGYDIVAGRHIARGALDWYWPCVARFMTLLAWLPFKTAGYVWIGVNVAALVLTLRLIGRRLLGLPRADWPVTMAVPLLVVLVFWYWEFRLNQIDNLTLLLMVGSYAAWESGRHTLGGASLGLAVVLKLTPGLLVIWFALKRQWRLVGVAAVTVVLVGPVADAITLGPERAADAYLGWADRALHGGSQRGLVLAQREMDWRNQGLGAVASRWLHPTNYNTHFDNDPRIQADAEKQGFEPRTFNVADLPRETVAAIVMLIVGVSLLGLLWLARRPAAALSTWQLRLEWALFVLAMLWLMPVMRRYHLIWMLPAVALLSSAVQYYGLRRGWSILTLVCMGLVLLIGLATIASPPLIEIEAGGSLLAAVAILALPVVVMLLKLRRRPAQLPPPCDERSDACATITPASDHG
jgi:hypothetical protein